MLRSISAVLLFICYPLLTISQEISYTPVPDIPKHMLIKLAWVDDDGFCIIADMTPSGVRISHEISYYDKAGKLKYRSDKIKTSSSSQNEYFFCIGKTIVYLATELDSYGQHDFFISASIQDNGITNVEPRKIFSILEKDEDDKLKSEKFSFHAYTGTFQKKALLVYNNDYKEPYPEGFRFKIIDSSLKMSAEDTFSLPYTDRMCNITDVVYDDINGKIFMLCELYVSSGKSDRVFQKSFIGSYDINTKQYHELNQIPSFKDNRIQHLIVDSTLAFFGILPESKDALPWSTTGITINLKEMNIKKTYSGNLDTAMLNILYRNKISISSNNIGLGITDGGGIGVSVGVSTSNRNELDLNFIHPLTLLKDAQGDYHCFWNYFPDMEDVLRAHDKKHSNQSLGFFTFGLVGVAAAGILTEKLTFENPSNIWITYGNEGTISPTCKHSSLRSTNYAKQSFNALNISGKIYTANNDSYNDKYKTQCSFYDKTLKCDSNIVGRLNKIIISTILPSSFFSQDGKNYFISMYEPGRLESEDPRYYLLEIK